jgi:signal peptidase I
LTAHAYSLPARPLPKTRQPTRLRRLLILSTALPLALLLSGAVFWMVPGVTLAHAIGQSMEPGLRQGDLLVFRATTADAVKVGDVIAYNRGEMPISHRVIEIRHADGGGIVLVTKGDNNARADAPIDASAVKAKLVMRIPVVGNLARMLGLGGGFDVFRYGFLMLSSAWLAFWAPRARALRPRQQREPIALPSS